MFVIQATCKDEIDQTVII